MLRLAGILYSLISTTLAGTFVIAVLVAGMGTLMPILYAAGAGFLISIPVAWYVARAIYN